MKYTLERAHPDKPKANWWLVGVGMVIGFVVTRFLVIG